MTRAGLSPLAWLDDRRAAAPRRPDCAGRCARGPRSAAELDLASNDYLGLSQHPAVIDGGVAALRTWGAGSTGSRLVTGNTELHEEFEAALAEFVGAEAALVFSSGYTANLGAVASSPGPAPWWCPTRSRTPRWSTPAGCPGPGSSSRPHCDVDAVEAALADRDEERALVVTDSVFSTDGALAPLRQLHEVCRAHRALLLVDEAHGLGVRGDGGRGLLHEARPGRCARCGRDDNHVQGAGQPGRRGARPGRGARPPDRRGAARSSSTPDWRPRRWARLWRR